MAKKQEVPKPLYSLKRDFALSLDNYMAKVSMLQSACESIITVAKSQPGMLSPKAAEILREHLDALRQASSGDD
jgi:hypothetical protein